MAKPAANLIIGCGYVGRRLAQAWLDTGIEVHATTRSPARAEEFSKLGIHPILWDITQDTDADFAHYKTVVFAVGFDRRAAKQTGQTIEEVYVRGLERALEKCPHAGRWIYLSSTGVYGASDGGWVDEHSPTDPNRDGGKACLAAEQLLLQHPHHGNRAIILRLAGIYGPDRLPQLALLKEGKPLSVAADAYLNLVHVEDIVQIILQCEKLTTPQTLCVSDGQPALRGDFYRYLAELTGAPAPIFQPPEPGSSRAERARGSKRIRNDRLVELLQPSFIYPSYREGLKAIVET